MFAINNRPGPCRVFLIRFVFGSWPIAQYSRSGVRAPRRFHLRKSHARTRLLVCIYLPTFSRQARSFNSRTRGRPDLAARIGRGAGSINFRGETVKNRASSAADRPTDDADRTSESASQVLSSYAGPMTFLRRPAEPASGSPLASKRLRLDPSSSTLAHMAVRRSKSGHFGVGKNGRRILRLFVLLTLAAPVDPSGTGEFSTKS